MNRVSAAAAVKWLIAAAAAQWLMIPITLRALLVFMTIDYITGLACGYVRKELSSQVGMIGLVKKGTVLLLLLTLHIAEQNAGMEIHLERACALAYILNELISIVENCAKVGVPIPSQIVTALLSAKKLRVTSATQAQIDELEKS